MRGLESHGMLLAASGEDHGSKPILATFSDEIALGSPHTLKAPEHPLKGSRIRWKQTPAEGSVPQLRKRLTEITKKQRSGADIG